jgi:hypothetical protein
MASRSKPPATSLQLATPPGFLDETWADLRTKLAALDVPEANKLEALEILRRMSPDELQEFADDTRAKGGDAVDEFFGAVMRHAICGQIVDNMQEQALEHDAGSQQAVHDLLARVRGQSGQ